LCLDTANKASVAGVTEVCIFIQTEKLGIVGWSRALLTYLLIPCSRVLIEELTGLQQVKKFPVFYGT
jgi:hypothetical protein